MVMQVKSDARREWPVDMAKTKMTRMSSDYMDNELTLLKLEQVTLLNPAPKLSMQLVPRL